jgi:hypothetical protein
MNLWSQRPDSQPPLTKHSCGCPNAPSHPSRSAAESKPPSEQRNDSAQQKRPSGWFRDGRRLKNQPFRHGQS